MTNQSTARDDGSGADETAYSELSVVSPSDAREWCPGTAEDGIDERIELARMDAGTRIAVRDAGHPSSPGLLFSMADWNALCGQRQALIDLR